MDQRGRNELVGSYVFDHRIAINLGAGYKSRNFDVGEMRNPIFVWCCTMETEPDAILSTWKDRYIGVCRESEEYGGRP